MEVNAKPSLTSLSMGDKKTVIVSESAFNTAFSEQLCKGISESAFKCNYITCNFIPVVPVFSHDGGIRFWDPRSCASFQYEVQ